MRKYTFLIVAAGLLVAADPKDDAAGKELKKFEGTWVMVKGEKDGKPIAKEHVKKGKITWKGDEVEVDTPHQSKETIKARTKLDPTKTPREMDFVRSSGPGAGKPFHGIYEFLNEDEYRVSFAPPGKDRPTDFKTQPGTGHMTHVWKRVKE